MMSKTLSNKIYYVTFILAILVVALHSSYVEFLDPSLEGYDFSFIIQRLFLVIGEAAVPTFFVISGFLLFTKFELNKYPKMLLSKVFSLVIPYLIWSVTASIIMQLIYPVIQGEAIEFSFGQFLLDILLANDCPHLWFVRPLLVFFICSPILYFVFKYLRKWSIFIPVVLFFVYLFFRPYYGGIILWIPLFFVGSYLSYFKISVLNPYRPRIIGWIALAVFVSLSIVFTLLHTEYEDYVYYVYRSFSPVLVWFSIDVLTSLFEKEKIREIFKTSGFIFFSHLFVVTGVKQVLQLMIPVNSNYHCALLFFLVLIFATAIDLVITYVLKKFANPVYKFIGGR